MEAQLSQVCGPLTGPDTQVTWLCVKWSSKVKSEQWEHQHAHSNLFSFSLASLFPAFTWPWIYVGHA